MLKLTDDAVFRESVLLQEVFAEGRQEGRQEGRLEGRHEGLEEGLERTLWELFLYGSGRAPTPAEQEALARRAHEITPEKFARLMIELPGQALIDWLLDKPPHGTAGSNGHGQG